MINLRYHIVSITAVFLALGMGLILGSTFLDRVTVDNLEHQLTEVEHQVRETRTENDALRERVGKMEERDRSLADQIPEQLLRGHLSDVPVLVIAVEGTDEALLTDVVSALANAGAQVSGSWRLTDRWSLDADDELSEAQAILGMTSASAARLRRTAAAQVAEALAVGALPTPAPETGVEAPGPVEPDVVRRLVEAGFVDYEPVPGSTEQRVLVPGSGARYLLVSSTKPSRGAQALGSALLAAMTTDGVAPVVAAQGLVELPDVDGRPATEDARRSTFVGPIRSNERMRSRLSTVDDLDAASGLAAVVLALEDVGSGAVGHFGVAPGAARLLPDPATQP